jgi:hypothetical protein
MRGVTAYMYCIPISLPGVSEWGVRVVTWTIYLAVVN